jgi:SPP1 family holin
MNAKADTVARTIILTLALINQILTTTGHAVIPISDDQITQLVSLIFTVSAALVAWWKNNSFSVEAIVADKYMKELKDETKKILQ